MAKHVIIALFAIVSTVLSQWNDMSGDMKILASDAGGLTVEFRPRYSAFRTIAEGETRFKLPQFDHGVSSLNHRPGAEEVKVRVVPVALPAYSGHRVSVLAADHETIGSFDLAPVPEITIVDALGASRASYRPAFDMRGIFVPEQMATVKEVANIRGRLIGKLVIAPYQYNAAARTLRRYTRLVIRIDFGVPSAPQRSAEEDELLRSTVINYSQSQAWTARTTFRKTAAVPSVRAAGSWAKLEVNEPAIYKIDANYLRALGFDPSALQLTDVKVFGADGRKIPEDISSGRPADLPQIAVDYVNTNPDPAFNDGDYILFYGQGVTGWNYDPVQKQFSHYSNPYTFSNYYFLGIGTTAPVQQAAVVSVSGTTGGRVTVVPGKAFFEEDKYNFLQSGQEWASAPINPNESRVVSTKLPGYQPGSTVTYRYAVYSRSNGTTEFSVEESGTVLGNPLIGPVDLDSYWSPYAARYETIVSAALPLADQRSNVKFTYKTNNTIATGYLDYLRIFYPQQLTASNDLLFFSSPDTNGTVEFGLTGYSSNDLRVYEVSRVGSLRRIVHSVDQQMGSFSVKDTLRSGTIHTYWAGTPSAYRTPVSGVRIGNSDLHSFAGAEFLIITHNDFRTEADRLKRHKESLPGSKRLSTAVFDVDTIYNEFGIGMPDPSAVRDFLKHAYDHWTVRPKYVLFFGDASYDFRSIQKNDRSWVPTFETSESNDKLETYANEDYFSYVDSNAPFSVVIAHGRLTPRSADEARLLVDKIINYESAPMKDLWKNLLTIVADDLWSSDQPNEYFNFNHAESMAAIPSMANFSIRKIYMEEYPITFSSSGRRRPDVRQAIIDQINAGTVLINYAGHGNPKVWAHENVFTIDDVRNQLSNGNKLTFIVAATCDWGRFEVAGEQSSAEEALINRRGGAIGVLSATRVVFAQDNQELNSYFLSNLFVGAKTMRLGDATLAAKNLSNDFDNKRKYFLLGDPTLRLAAPEGSIVVDTILRADGTAADTLRALDKIIVKASVRDSVNAHMNGFSGSALLTVFDSDRIKNIPTMGTAGNYRDDGALIYKGDLSVTNGRLTATFIVPKDISYTNLAGRIIIYFFNNESDGRGYTKNFIVGGTNPSVVKDSVGPELSIFFNDTKFRPGDLVNDNPKLIVVLRDSSGINSSTNSIGHRLEAWLDGSAKSVDLTEFYRGKTDSYQEGTAEYQLSQLSPGSHSVKVRAWDVHNNSSAAETYFSVAAGSSLSIHNVFNFPNPVSTTTSFTFQHNQSSAIDVTIHIYTVTGRLIHTLRRPVVTDRFVKIDWDRRDGDGDEVGNGIYFYKVIATTADGALTSEALGKMAVVR